MKFNDTNKEKIGTSGGPNREKKISKNDMVRNNSLYKFDITNLDEASKDCENYIAN